MKAISFVILVTLGCGNQGLTLDAGGSEAPPDAVATTTEIFENEADGIREDDFTPISVPLVTGGTVIIHGAIGSYQNDGAGGDGDQYTFSGHAGDVLTLEIRATAGSDVHPRAVLIGDWRSMLHEIASPRASDPHVVTRQFYLPVDLDYTLVLTDARNDAGGELFGGPAEGYDATLTLSRLRPDAAVYPVQRSAPIGEDIPVHAWNVDLVAGQRVRLFAPASAASDPAIYLTGENGQLIEAGGSGLPVRWTVERSGTYTVVLDHVLVTDTSSSDELTLDGYTATGEVDPNNDYPVPIAGIGTDLTETIDRVDEHGRQRGDNDFFSFTTHAGEAYEIIVTRLDGANPDFVPVVTFNGAPMVDGKCVGSGVARLEAYAPGYGDGFVQIGVGDGHPWATPHGGPDYGYRLQVRAGRHVETPMPFPGVGAPGAITQCGSTVWYSFTIPGPTAQAVELDLDLSGHDGVDGLGLHPRLSLYAASDLLNAIVSDETLLTRQVLLPGDYLLGVADARGDSSPDHHAFRPRIAAIGDVTAAADLSGAHSDQANALDISPLPAIVDEEGFGYSSHWYALGTIAGGATLKLELTESPYSRSVKNVIVLAADGTEVARTILRGSATAYLPMPATALYYVDLEGIENDYGLARFSASLTDCPPGAARGPVAREVTIDEVTDPAHLVALVNHGATDTLALDDVVLRDASGEIFHGCNQTLAAGAALTVPGGVDAAGGTLFLLDAAGHILDRLTLGAGAPFPPPPSPLPGDTCASAVPVASGDILRGESLYGYRDVHEAICIDGPAPGPERYYRITIPAGQILQATAVPREPTLALALYAIPVAECAGPHRCDSGYVEGYPKLIEYPGDTDTDVFIVVDSRNGGGTFDLYVEIGPPWVP